MKLNLGRNFIFFISDSDKRDQIRAINASIDEGQELVIYFLPDSIYLFEFTSLIHCEFFLSFSSNKWAWKFRMLIQRQKPVLYPA